MVARPGGHADWLAGVASSVLRADVGRPGSKSDGVRELCADVIADGAEDGAPLCSSSPPIALRLLEVDLSTFGSGADSSASRLSTPAACTPAPASDLVSWGTAAVSSLSSIAPARYGSMVPYVSEKRAVLGTSGLVGLALFLALFDGCIEVAVGLYL